MTVSILERIGTVEYDPEITYFVYATISSPHHYVSVKMELVAAGNFALPPTILYFSYHTCSTLLHK